ncbi:MAG: carboxypeptidase regulatory-like domain-containing protein [Acidobacteriota bacterium]|nr:carboxypeptidase regulatory-like domain-containing protein [Acidobacteriota bacterium]
MLRKVLARALAALLVVGGTGLYAQGVQTGTISGVVHDASGGVLPGVTMTMTSTAQGTVRTAVTDQNGRYVFPGVPVGQYRVGAVLQGFQAAEATNNLVETSKTTTVDFTLAVGTVTDVVQVVGETPIVDPTTVTQTTRLTRDEFEKLPVGRSYQALMGAAPGVVGTGNANSAGALTSNNLFVIDAVDTTDPTTGTFGTNINFESIQEVSILTTAAGAEYGRAQGAIVNVVTKSGTNKFEGAAKYIFLNDKWDAQNKTASETTGASLARVKFDQINPIYSFAGGGPIVKNHAFFFGTWELQKNTTPQRQTAGQIPEDFQQTTESKFANIRGTVALGAGHTAWVKYHQSPTNGFVRNDYWGTTVTGDRAALTAQDQTNESFAAQYSGVLRSNWAVEAAFSTFKINIDVGTFEPGILNNAPIFNLTDNKYYNGATFDGTVNRPRQQANVASNWFLTLGNRAHNVKAGYDFQNLESESQFDYPNRQLYIADDYIQATRTPVFGPNSSREDYDSGPSVSTGKIHAVYVRDKFEVSDRLSVEAGLRVENQTGSSDIGVSTVDTTVLAPRLSGSYALTEDSKTLVTASYGRYHASIIQNFSDAFAQVAQQTNYDNYVWNGSAFVFSNRVEVGGSSFATNLELKPSHLDESTIGFQRQIGASMGVGARFIYRKWGNLIDDVRTFNPDNTINRQVLNYDEAERDYRGMQFTLEKRFADNWNAAASYTYSRTRGNHFGDTFTTLGDYLDASCRTTADPTVGDGGVISCAEVQNGANKSGAPTYDRPHNFKLAGAYVRPVGPVNFTLGAVTEMLSKFRYQKERTVNVLLPGTVTNQGSTATYYYNERGSDPIEGMEWFLDTALEATWKIAGTHNAGFKAEVFNVTDRQEKLRSNNVVWCGSGSSAACQTAIDNFGKATARTAFRGGVAGTSPRAYRFSLIYRF